MSKISQPEMNFSITGGGSSNDESEPVIVIPPGQGIIRLDDAFWQNVQNSQWDGGNNWWEKIDLSGPGSATLAIGPLNGWEVGYRPQSIKIELTMTGSGTEFDIEILDKDFNSLYGEFTVSAEPSVIIEGDLTFVSGDPANDIGEINFLGSDIDVKIVNIEFFD